MSTSRRQGTKPLTTSLVLNAHELRALLLLQPPSSVQEKLLAAYKRATRRRWSRERVIEALRLWATRYGEPPRSRDWNYSKLQRDGAEEKLQRYIAGGWPSTSTVEDYFGGWNAALRAAGFGVRKSGNQRI